MNGEAAGPLFFLFLSAFGFFFSRLPLNWPFAISSSLRGYPHIACASTFAKFPRKPLEVSNRSGNEPLSARILGT
jgi:hypothetical protein